MTWNTNIQEAPRGRVVAAERRVKSDDGARRIAHFDQFIRDDLILETKCGKVIKSYWIPDENRWAGFANGEQPVAWQEWPKPSRGGFTDAERTAILVSEVTFTDDCGSGA